MKKLAFLAVVLAGVAAMAATCVIRGATVTTIDGDVWYSAEMDNETTADILDHSFAVGFIEGSNLATSKTVDGCLRSLQAGNSDFFAANSGLNENDVDTAVSRLVGPFTFGSTTNGDISFSGIVATRNDELLRVTGRVTNDDNDDLENVRVCVVVRNDDGDITVVEADNNDYDLNSDQAATFSVDVTVPDDNNDVDKVDLWVDATNKDNDDQVTEPESKLGTNVDTCPNPTNTPVGTNTPTTTATATPTNTPATTPTAVPTATPDDAC